MSRLIDADALKRKAQRVATESWKMRLTARIETTLNQFIDWIDNAPTVQPEPDCSLKEFGDCSYSEAGCSDCKIKNRIRTALNVAQPEIIRCKNCKYWVVEEDEAYCYRIVMVHGAKDGSGFCSDAERKMDNERTD